MRRARIQIKPNVAKAAKQSPSVVKLENSPVDPPIEAPPPEEDAVPAQVEIPHNSDDVAAISEPNPAELLHVDVKPVNIAPQVHHVHFNDDVVDRNEQQQNTAPRAHLESPIGLLSGQSSPQFVAPHPPSRMITPRSRNVSMCEDEAILQPKQPREKKRFTGKEELDTKTWKMSDLVRWNPRNDQTSFKRERRSSTSSTIITKSELGEVGDVATPRTNAPQVKIGADGRLVIDESSLLVQSAQINHESVWETVEEGRMGSKITSMSFRNRIFRKAISWTERETDLFYEVLRCTGQDFGLMHHYLPQRSRPELKAKYNREEKLNWPRLLKAISHPVRLDSDLETRIAQIMADMEEEAKSKRERNDYEKAEEKKMREQIREQRATERVEERMKKAHAKELVRQARELEKEARVAAKSTEKAEKAEKAKERMDAKQLAKEAKRIATEAKQIIRDARQQELALRNETKRERSTDQDNLEREAERIIRRLIQESQREEKRKAKAERKRKKSNASKPSTSAPYSPSSGALESETVDPLASGGELGDTTSDSSTTASSSDEEALKMKEAKREKERMKAERRNLEPRRTVIDKKPVYVDKNDAKWAQQPVSEAVELVKMANGNMFDSADEMDVVDNTPLLKSSAPDTPDAPETPESASPVENATIPKAVSDVIEDIARERSKTPKPHEPEEKEPEVGEPPAKIIRTEEGAEDEIIDVVTIETVAVPDHLMDVAEFVDVETTDVPSTSTAPPPPPRPSVIRRTVKKPMPIKKKK
ncbi:unnamed protein product [Caenorhabditis sp. 36 PRJEB53466]|nr:unnamed protein product [Caenorhabditis sp. 36 PRJEB53466]